MDGSVWNPEQAAAVARRVVEANDYLTLATADADGTPWATPVWFAADGLAAFYWVSRMNRRHSENIDERPEVALAIFDSTTPVGQAEAVYVEALAGQVDDDGLADALAVFNAKSQARGIRAWREAEVTGDVPHRLYLARATEVFVLDPDEQRVRL
jgi:nitroimidazol reductase NimA-like FMN-containing flavoprotein (pyridoxamine 5'-phosphate oxidase superfamily)